MNTRSGTEQMSSLVFEKREEGKIWQRLFYYVPTKNGGGAFSPIGWKLDK